MATRSTASSSTDPAGPTAGPAAGDLGRRTFFRHLGRSALATAGNVAGAAETLRREAGLTASALTGPDEDRRPAAVVPTPASDDTGFRSPYRIDGDTLLVVDQRNMPERLDDLVCADGRDACRVIRQGAVSGGVLMAHIAAYGVLLTARRPGRGSSAARAAIEMDLAAFRQARPSAQALQEVVARIEARLSTMPDDAPLASLAEALHELADGVAMEVTRDHAALVGHGAAWLRSGGADPLQVLLHGSTGAMASGMIGTATSIVTRLASEGRPLHVWITEGRPTGEGARVTTWELRHAGVPHTVVPDAGVPWLLASHPPDAVLLAAEWLAANGDAAVFAGGSGVAALAAAAGSPIPVLLCAPWGSYHEATPTGTGIPVDLRTGREVAGLLHTGTPPGTQVLAPAADIVDARHVAGIVTPSGVVTAPFTSSLTEAYR